MPAPKRAAQPVEQGPPTDTLGPCGCVPRCSKDCQGFIRRTPAIGPFETCVCTHTKQIHQRIEVAA